MWMFPFYKFERNINNLAALFKIWNSHYSEIRRKDNPEERIFLYTSQSPPLSLVPWRGLNQTITLAVCRCQKTFQFGEPPSGPSKLPLQKAASPQVVPSGVGRTSSSLTPLLCNADEGPAPWACLFLHTTQHSLQENRSTLHYSAWRAVSLIHVRRPVSEHLDHWKWADVNTLLTCQDRSVI